MEMVKRGHSEESSEPHLAATTAKPRPFAYPPPRSASHSDSSFLRSIAYSWKMCRNHWLGKHGALRLRFHDMVSILWLKVRCHSYDSMVKELQLQPHRRHHLRWPIDTMAVFRPSNELGASQTTSHAAAPVVTHTPAAEPTGLPLK